MTIDNKIFLYSFLLLLLSACGGRDANFSSNTPNTFPVSVVNVATQDIASTLTVTGTVQALKEMSITSEVTGNYRLMKNPLTGKHYKMGDRVKYGAVVVRLENEEYINGIRYESKKLDVEIKEKDVEAQQAIYEKGGITYKDKINAENAYNESKYALEDAEMQLKKVTLTAPFDGVITALPYYTQGTKIPASHILTMMDYDEMYMDVQFSEKNIKQIGVGQEVLVSSYTLKDETLKGFVEQISPVVNMETRTFGGRLKIDNPDGLLRPGMFVQANIVLAEKDSVIVIPQEVIRKRNGKNHVFVVEKNRAVERQIELGIETDRECEVTKGLAQGERLVVEGFEALHEGSRVRVK